MRWAIPSVLVLAALLAAPAAAGGSVGIVPAEIRTIALLPGSAYSFTLHLQNTHEVELSARLVVRADADDPGDAVGWARLDSYETRIPPNATRSAEATVTIPDDVPAGEYRLIVVATFDTRGAVAGSGFGVDQSVASRLVLNVSREEIRSFRLLSAQVPDGEEGIPLAALVVTENQGNVRETLDGYVEVRRASDGALVHNVTIPQGLTVPPLAQRTLTIPLPPLEYGQYTARVVATRAAFEDAFKIYSPGSLAKDARIHSLNHAPRAVTETTLRVEALVENTGPTLIGRAVLSVDFLLGDRIGGRVDSEPLRLDPGQESSIPVHLALHEAGTYTLRAVLAYDGWRSEVSESILSVTAKPPEASPPWIPIAVILALGGVVVAFLAGRKTA